MDHRVVGATHGRRRGDTEDPSVLGAGWGETGGRDRFPMSSTSRFGDYREGDHAEDGHDRGRSRYNINNNRRGRGDRRYDSSGSMRDNQRYNEDDYEDDYDRRRGNGSPRRGLGRRDVDNERDYYRAGDYSGPDLRGDDSMERFRQGKDVKKSGLYGFETANTPSSKKRIGRRKGGGDRRMQDRPRDGRGDPRGSTVNGSYNNNNHRRDSTVNGSYNRGPQRDNGGRRRDGGGRINGSAGRDRGLSLDDLNEML